MKDALDGIAAEARTALGAPGEVGQDAEPELMPPQSDQAKQEEEAREWSAIPYVLGRMCVKAFPELEPVYSESACLEWGRLMVPIARKYSWSLGAASPWVALAVCSWHFVDPTLAAIKRKRAAGAKHNAGPAAAEQQPDNAAETPAPAGDAHPDGSPKG